MTRTIPSAAPAVHAGTAAILVAATLWGTTGTAQSFVLDDAQPLSVGSARIVLGGLLLFAAALLAGRGADLRRLILQPTTASPSRWLLLAGVVAVAIYQVTFFAAVATTGVAVGTVVTIGSGPAFAGLIAAIVGQRPSARWLLSTAGAVTGIAVLVGSGESGGVDPSGIALALLAGFGYAVYVTVAGRFIASGSDHIAVVGVLFAGAGVLLLPGLVASRPTALLTGTGLAVIVYLGVVTTAVAYVLYARGLRTTAVPVATTLTLAEPVVAALLGVVILGEHLGAVATGGLVLVALSLLVLVRR